MLKPAANKKKPVEMKLRCERRTGGGDPVWSVWLTDGTELTWRDFATGPVVLDDDEITRAARELLGMTTTEVSAAATLELRPFIATGGAFPPAVLMHSATQTTKGFEGDLSDVHLGRMPYDVPGYLEARMVSLGGPGDITVGRTKAWREATEVFGTAAIAISDTDHYYLSHALVMSALAHQRARVPEIDELIAWVAAHPTTVVRLYALDVETQIFLVWLKRQAGLEALAVDANAPAVAHSWNQKTPLHPTVAAAEALAAEVANRDIDEVLAVEQRESEAYTRLALAIPVLPGYRLVRGADPESFVAQARAAATLLRERYGITRGCLKPCEAGDGARIVPNLDLDGDQLAIQAADAHRHGDDYLLEAHVDFLRVTVTGDEFIVAPSGHIRNGHVAPGLTVQLMRGCAWEGNAYFDEASAGQLGLTADQYKTMMDGMQRIRDAFHGDEAKAEGCYRGLVTGGVDFAVGTVGGRFGDRVLVAVIDLNLSSHGAEYMRAFLDEVQQRQVHGYVATRVFRPAVDATLVSTEQALEAAVEAPHHARMVGCVGGSWAMLATTGADTIDATARALRLEDALEAEGLALKL